MYILDGVQILFVYHRSVVPFVQIRFVNGFPQSRELIYIIQFYMSPMSIEDLDILTVFLLTPTLRAISR